MKARRMISSEELEKRTGLSRTTLYRYMDAEGFPRAVLVGKRAMWVVEEVDNWFDVRRVLGAHIPKPRQGSKHRPKKAAPQVTWLKPRIYKQGEAWCINADSNLTLRSNSPVVVYRLWEQHTRPLVQPFGQLEG